MADEIFALSPIAARPVQPGEADYDAIKEAFMETSRGRWFLGEYAKRNRNADTKMVLDAVSRIEETIAAQKKPVRDPVLDEALASFRAALVEARDAANAAVNDLAIEQNLAPVRKGARVIREIAWRLREIGADGRICDLIDSQVAAIEGAAGRLNPSDLASVLSGAFDRIEGKIAAFDEADDAPAARAPVADGPAAETSDIAPLADAQVEAEVQAETQAEIKAEEQPAGPVETTVQAPSATPETEARIETNIAAAAEPVVAVADASAVEPPPVAAAAEPASDPADTFDADDEALLDMVAMEMAAPDTDEAYEPSIEELRAQEAAELEAQERQLREAQVHAPQVEAPQVQEAPKEPHVDKPQPEPARDSAGSWEIDVTFAPEAGDAAAQPAVATALPAVTPLQPEPEPQPEPALAAAATGSLGSSLIANGIVPRPRAPGPDPMAPIRRMSQNEKIAFFS